jgi:hypothetical protein
MDVPDVIAVHEVLEAHSPALSQTGQSRGMIDKDELELGPYGLQTAGVSVRISSGPARG